MNLLIVMLVLPGVTALTSTEMATAKHVVRTLVHNNSVEQGDGRVRLPFIGTLVRLSFHDCVGGCDGCVDTSNPSNSGLEQIIDKLDEQFVTANINANQKISEAMSRADFYVLAAITALEMGLEVDCGKNCVTQTLAIEFRTGRTDTNCSSPPTRIFPEAHDGIDKTLSFFDTEFGFTASETTALLGAHTLGQASAENSGFKGPWVNRRDRLDNQYFTDLADASKNWAQIDVGGRDGPRVQWNHNGEKGGPMMLNSDMCLLKDIQLEANNGTSSCTYTSCTETAQTATTVRKYAADNNAFIQDFSAVFQKMIDHGSSSLQPITQASEREELLGILQQLLKEERDMLDKQLQLITSLL